MKHFQVGSALGRLVSLVIAAVLPLVAHAEDKWKTEASINLWLPSIGGSTSFPPSGGGPTIDVTADKIIDALKMAFMGTLDIRKDQWGFFADVAYVDLGDSKYGTRDFSLGNVSIPVGLDANLNLDVKATAWTLAGFYTMS
jgi:hypothetical protein